jgi:hypothetical protein
MLLPSPVQIIVLEAEIDFQSNSDRGEITHSKASDLERSFLKMQLEPAGPDLSPQAKAFGLSGMILANFMLYFGGQLLKIGGNDDPFSTSFLIFIVSLNLLFLISAFVLPRIGKHSS